MKIYLPWKMGTGEGVGVRRGRRQLSREIIHVNGLTLPTLAAGKWIKSKGRKNCWKLMVRWMGSHKATHSHLEVRRQKWHHERLSDLQRWATCIKIGSLWITNTFLISWGWKQETGSRNELDMGPTHRTSKGGERCLQPVIKCYYRDSKTMRTGWGEL